MHPKFTFRLLFRIKTLSVLMTLACILLFQSLSAQSDTLFWFAAPEIVFQGKPIFIRVTAQNETVIVNISQPANPNFPNQILNINAGNTQSIDLTEWIDQIENKPPNNVLNYGLKITSNHPISVYYEASGYLNPELFILKGTNALGNNFLIPAQNLFSNRGDNSSFNIVATENNTNVTIIPSEDIFGHPRNVSFTINLNEGETYSAVAIGTDPSDHLDGSKVTSDKPIAITIKDGHVNYGRCADLGGDQIIPIDKLGTEYIATNGVFNISNDLLFIMATEDDTRIEQNGSLVETIDEGETVKLDVGKSSSYIKTSAPAYVLQMSGNGCELGMDVLPPLNCSGSSEISFVRSAEDDLYVTLLTTNDALNDFYINGIQQKRISNFFNEVPETNGRLLSVLVDLKFWTYPQGSVITISNTSAKFQAGIIHGNQNGGTRFGYISDFESFSSDISIDDDEVCEGETINFSSRIPLGNAVFNWTGPNNFSANTSSPSIENVLKKNEGMYFLSVEIPGCDNIYDSIELKVFEVNIDTITEQICAGLTYTFPDGDTATVSKIDISIFENTWNCDSIIVTKLNVIPPYFKYKEATACAGETFTFPNGDTTTISKIDTSIFKTIWNCDSIIVTNFTASSIQIKYDTICTGEIYEFLDGDTSTISKTDTSKYINTAGCNETQITHLSVLSDKIKVNHDTICKGESFTLPNGDVVSLAGTYNYPLYQNKCNDKAIMILEYFPEITFNTKKSNALCFGSQDGTIETFVLSGQKKLNYELAGIQNITGSFNNLSAGIYTLNISDEHNCIVTESIEILEPNKPEISLSPQNPTIDINSSVTLEVSTNITNAQFKWHPADFLSCDTCPITIAKPNQNISYRLTISEDKNGNICSIDTILNISVHPYFILPNTISLSGIEANRTFSLIGTNLDNLLNFEIFIFNRWGHRIFESKDVYFQWDGKHNSKQTHVGSYIYKIRYQIPNKRNDIEYKYGNIMVIQ